MRISLLISCLLLFTACSTTPELPQPHEKITVEKIQSNQSAALAAQVEYKKLQAQRNKV